MSNPQTESPTESLSWSKTVTRILAWQLNLLETHYRVGFDVVEASLGFFSGAKETTIQRSDPKQQPSDDVQKLEALALENVQKGIAPPKKIYSVPYRDRIDWAKFPAWARPIDPEIFEGAGHEG
jgi:hypothetical protein